MGQLFASEAWAPFCIPNPMNRRDLLIAPAGEAFLILVVAIAGWLTRQPLIFASLGPTAYELIETPHRRSARPWNIFVGHLAGIGAAWLALLLTHSWNAPAVSASGVPALRIGTATLAAALTVLGTLVLRASQPAAIATALLIALGLMQAPRESANIMAAVVIMIVIGEPLRRWRVSEQARLGKTLDERA
jgi:CBS domain-containing membrane protein